MGRFSPELGPQAAGHTGPQVRRGGKPSRDRSDRSQAPDRCWPKVAVGDHVMNLATVVELVRILDAIDQAVDELEDK